MSETTENIKKQIAEMTRVTNIPDTKIEKIEKEKIDKRITNGGTRKGSGRKAFAEDEKRRTLKQSWENFALGQVDVQRIDKGTKEVRIIKMNRLQVAQEKLFKLVEEKDVTAIKEFNDRTLGKSRQPMTIGNEDETPLRIEVDLIDKVKKTYGIDGTTST